MAETTGVSTPGVDGVDREISGTSDITSHRVDQYDDRFAPCDANGQTLAHAPYGLQRENGAFEYGETDGDGHTHLLAVIASTEKINVYVAG